MKCALPRKNMNIRSQTLLIAGLLATGATVQADVVTDWNAAALQAIRGYRTTPPAASRGLAILHISIYDAVNGISRRHEPYLVPSTVPAGISKEAAASAAAHTVLTALFPTNAPMFDALHAATLAGIRNGPLKAKGVAWGREVAAKVMQARANDGSTVAVTPLPPSAPGDWVPTPPANAPYLLPQWGSVMPFAMASSTQFRPAGPPALDSEKYAADFNEVKALGGMVSALRTEDQTQIARFWADGAGTETPPGHWNHIAQDVGAALGNSLEENARLFALMNIAMADAAICAWDAKYHYHNWRPVTAIRNAADDGNPATEPDATWSSLIGTPPFPDYVSGHSTFSAAAATVLALFYGTDDVAFTTGSDFMPGVMRSFGSFSAAAEEAGMSRVYGGIHFKFASDDGLEGGMKIGQWTFNNYLRAKGNRSRH
jgi:hypothetical protein